MNKYWNREAKNYKMRLLICNIIKFQGEKSSNTVFIVFSTSDDIGVWNGKKVKGGCGWNYLSCPLWKKTYLFKGLSHWLACTSRLSIETNQFVAYSVFSLLSNAVAAEVFFMLSFGCSANFILVMFKESGVETANRPSRCFVTVPWRQKSST